MRVEMLVTPVRDPHYWVVGARLLRTTQWLHLQMQQYGLFRP